MSSLSRVVVSRTTITVVVTMIMIICVVVVIVLMWWVITLGVGELPVSSKTPRIVIVVLIYEFTSSTFVVKIITSVTTRLVSSPFIVVMTARRAVAMSPLIV